MTAAPYLRVLPCRVSVLASWAQESTPVPLQVWCKCLSCVPSLTGVSPDLEEDEEEATSPLAAATSQPALMTVGEDGVIRIWVEVGTRVALRLQTCGTPPGLAVPAQL